MRAKIHTPKPDPLTPEECTRIWRWERQMLVFYTIAMLLISGAVVFIAFAGDQQWARLSVIGMIVTLMAIGWFVQFRESCPRCGVKLGRQARVLLPVKCKSCGVQFPRRQDGSAPLE